ncbi:serine/threonine-protein phosphatase 7 long form homolog [Arachis hypogaea]|uniref:serine/threonine-protein phosphatase 7 long form homolog n=1 Tax=Arachis hypogaea TaxID=3818 RepID=UPI003B222E37
MRGHSALLSALVERWRLETHTFHLPVGEVTMTLEDVTHILGLPVNGELVTGKTDSSHQFFVENCIACFGREPGLHDHVLGKVNLDGFGGAATPNRVTRKSPLSVYHFIELEVSVSTSRFPPDSTIQLGAASLAHLYRSLCRASRYNCKEMDRSLILLFVWVWERMPFLAPISCDQLVDVGVPLARRWSHWRRHTRYTRKPTVHFRRGLNDMGVDDSPLVSFECIEWHPTDRVRRQFGLQQLPLDPVFEIGRDHCRRLTGPQNHDWRGMNNQWVNLWISGHYNTLQLRDEIVDFHPLPVYYE